MRDAFPTLAQRVNGHSLVYLDSAGTALKPTGVLDVMHRAYTDECATIHRGLYSLSTRATARFEKAREKVAQLLRVSADEIIFTGGTTESLNAVAWGLGRQLLQDGDEVLVSELEHHSNLLPWQRLCVERRAILRVLPLRCDGHLALDTLDDYLSCRTRVVAISHLSNSLGSVTDIKYVANRAHAVGAVVVVDGAQAVPHMPTHMADLGADFYAFSGHKLYGPFGVGVLWGRAEYLKAMEPWRLGGGMVRSVSHSEGVIAAEVPHRFEAGTPNIAGVIGLGAAIDWLLAIGYAPIEAHEAELMSVTEGALGGIDGLSILGPGATRKGVLSLVMEDIHPHDAATILDSMGIAVRAGHHCAQPVMERLGILASLRVSLGIYNSQADIHRLVGGIQEIRSILGRGR